jgi:hypothetical protein
MKKGLSCIYIHDTHISVYLHMSMNSFLNGVLFLI